MDKRRLGHSDLHVSVVGMGCWQLDTGYWGSTEAEVIAAVHAALDCGINLFDTAEGYGHGRSEQILGKALADRRDQAVIATKISAGNLAVEQVRPHCEASLERLGTDYIDLYQIHWPTRQVPMERSMEELVKLQKEGKIRHIGVSNFDCQQMDLVRSRGSIVSLQPPFSLFWREIEDEILPYCRQHNISVLAYSPLAQGLLTGRFNRQNRPAPDEGRNVLFQDSEAYERCVGAVEQMKPIADAQGAALSQLAIQWVLSTEGVTSALVGARRADQVRANAAAAEVQLPRNVYEQLDRISRQALEGVALPRSMWNWYPDKALDEQERREARK